MLIWHIEKVGASVHATSPGLAYVDGIADDRACPRVRHIVLNGAQECVVIGKDGLSSLSSLCLTRAACAMTFVLSP